MDVAFVITCVSIALTLVLLVLTITRCCRDY